jgi:hypothetical protein
MTEEAKYRIKRLIFRKWKKLRMIQGLEKSLKLDDRDLSKYLDAWESKVPVQPTYMIGGQYNGTCGAIVQGVGQMMNLGSLNLFNR